MVFLFLEDLENEDLKAKLDAVDYAIEHNVPLFGICLGMHSIVTQFARRNGYPEANSCRI